VSATTLERPDIATFDALHARIVAALEAVDGGAFTRDAWTRETGHGVSAVLEGDAVIERGAVLVSHLRGTNLPATASARRPHLAGSAYTVSGVSVVVHPRNPHAPTAHMNVRRFTTATTDGWVGGGMDLTPYLLYPEDATLFHRAAFEAQPSGYATWKRECDAYFHLPHRGEARGVGGIFFDDLSPERPLELLEQVVNAFVGAYTAILERRKDTPFTDDDRAWQLERRGRYAEFNLVWDRGTAFGLKGGGRTQSILASLPPLATWAYQDRQPSNDRQRALLEVVRAPRDWLED
jgi:coproporphyrinogen III oxidase